MPHQPARALGAPLLPTLLLAGLAAAALPVAAPLHAQAARAEASAATSARGLRYAFTMSSSKDDETRGAMTVVGDRARLDIERGSSLKVGGEHVSARARKDEDRDWFLLTDGGRRITIVDPQEREYRTMDAEEFTGLLGTVMKAVDTFLTMEVQDATVSVERLGDGGMVAGRPTQRWAVVQEFTTEVGMFGKTERELHRVVTDYWIAPGLTLPDNPLFELASRGETALAQANERYVRRVARARAALPKGAVLRSVVTAASSPLTSGEVKPPKVQRFEVTGIDAAALRRDALEVPSGYKRSTSKSISIDL